jgi:hypothetical protein
VHDAAADRPVSSPSARTTAVTVAPGPNTPADGDSRADAIPGVSRTTRRGTDTDEAVDSRTADSVPCVDLLCRRPLGNATSISYATALSGNAT